MENSNEASKTIKEIDLKSLNPKNMNNEELKDSLKNIYASFMVSKKLALDLVDHMENLKVKIKEFEDVLSDRLGL